ncbi:MAG: hypothetical protein WEC35_03960 [Nitrosopumilaceae archaeon]
MPSIKWITLLVVAIIIGFGALGVVLDSINTPSSPNNKRSDYRNLEDESIKDIILGTDVSINSSVAYIDSQYVKEYSLPNGTWPNGILVGRDGMVWTAGSRSHTLLSFDPEDGQIKSAYPIKEESSSDVMKGGSLMVWSMVEGNDGFIWFSQFGPDRLWRFDPNTEKFQVFRSISAPPFQMKVDKDTGNIWFTTLTGNTLGVIQKIENKNESSPEYKITEFDMDSDSNPSGLFLEKDHVWVSQISNNKLVKFNVVTDSNDLVIDVVRISEISSSEGIPIYSPTDLLIQNDNLWFTEHGTSTITKYQTESQNLTRFPTSANPYQTTTLPFWIREATGGDGHWFNEHTGNRIAFLNTKGMTLLEYEIPTRPSDGYIVYPLGIAVDPANSNKLWFSEWNTDKIAVVDLNIPVSFDIFSDTDKIVLSGSNNTADIDVKITRKSFDLSNGSNNIVYLRASSSMEPAAGFVNVTVNFSTDTINFTSNETTQVYLHLQNDAAPLGNYTLAISATDGAVTKSIFLDLIVN